MLPADITLELSDFIAELPDYFIGLMIFCALAYLFLGWRIWVEYKKGKARDRALYERINRRAMIARMQLPEAQPTKEKDH